jgi:hypothetical protein
MEDEGISEHRSTHDGRERDRVDGGKMLCMMVTIVPPLAMDNGASKLKLSEFAEVVGTRPKVEIEYRCTCQDDHLYLF